MALTGKQERFVQELVKGSSQRQAYINAGYSSKDKSDNYLDSKASQLFKKDKVRERYNALTSELQNDALWTREQAINEYLSMKDRAKKEIDSKGIKMANMTMYLKCIESLNKLCFEHDLKQAKLEAEINHLKKKVETMDKIDNEDNNDLANALIKLAGGHIDD
ncbi:terminase small subunit [Macrococcus equi]|uniref:terminase small subunit n=1 Tax=Macrococcus equi TaxID=3395462 RepID=UPI0039BDCB1F